MEQLLNAFLPSPLQKRVSDLWRDGRAYNTMIRIEVDGLLQMDSLAEALQRIGQRHEIFRTSFLRQPHLQYPVQVVNEEYRLLFQTEDISLLEETQQTSRLAAIREQLLLQPFDLEAGSLLGAFAVRLSADRHILFLFSPLLAADAETMYNVAAELLDGYSGNDPSAGGEPLQFLQYSEWQNMLLTEDNQEASAYWKSQHLRTTSLPAMPFVQMEAREASASPRTVKVPVSGTLHQTIDKYIRDTQKTLPDFILSCWVALLWHHACRPEELSLDRVESGRKNEAFKEINGLLARPLPFHVRILQEDSFDQLYRKVAEEDENNRLFQDHYERFGNACDIGYESYKMASSVISRDGLTFHIDSIDASIDLFRIKLRLIQYTDRWNLDLHYYPADVPPAAVEWIREQLTGIMTAATANTGETLKDLMTISDKERAFLLDEVNNTTTGLVPTDYVSLFEAQVDKTPALPAVRFGDNEWSYAQLDKEANRIAAFLIKEKGVSLNDIVAVKMARSPRMLACLLAIMKAGGVFLPIDTQAPAERVDFMLNDSNARLLLTDESLLTAADTATEVVPVVEDTDFSYLSDTRPGVSISPKDLVYIIYTSGSTGKPKGALISHGSFTNYLQWATNAFDINTTDSTLLFSSVAFDLGYTSLWTALINGSTLHIMEETPYLDPDKLISRLIEKNITYIKLTASHFSLIAGDPDLEKNAARYSLRLVILGGEPIRAADVENFVRLAPNTRFVCHYGPTETTIGVIAGVMDTTRPSLSVYSHLIGRPIDNNRVYILNENNELSPVGIPGEIGIAGAGLANGYLKREELTAQKFIPHPLAPGETLYRTGDIGKWTADGLVHLLGRNDDQVKIRGYRVETGEIERVFRQHPQVRDAVVLPFTEGPDGPALKAFLVTEGKPLTPSEWKAVLGRTLPEYMIPEHFAFIPEIPLLPNGKTDKQSLLNLKSTGMVNEMSHTLPKTKTEETVAGVWKNILMKDNIDADESFFNCGGNSLKLVRVFRELAKIFPDRKLTVTELFKYTTIQAISEYLDNDDKLTVAGNSEDIESFEF